MSRATYCPTFGVILAVIGGWAQITSAQDCNHNGVPDACELPNGCATGDCGTLYPADCGRLADCQPNGIPDVCELGGGGYVYQVDDGTHEDSIGLTVGGKIAWMNHFTVVSGGESIISISLAWGSVPDGTPCTVYVWNDPDGDGNPADARVIASAPTLVANGNTDILATVSIPAAAVGPAGTSFFAGAMITHGAYDYPASVDQNSALHGQSWFSGDTTGNLDPNNLGGGDGGLVNIDTISGLEGNWLIRATAQGAGSDCNGNGIPDECDIRDHPEWDCSHNGVIDTCEWVDCNNNGRLDACDIAAGTSQDCNHNGIPDECELGQVKAVVLSEGFEGTVPPATWTAVVTIPGFTWTVSPYGAPEGSQYAACAYDPWLRTQDEWLITPTLNMSGQVALSGQSMGSIYWGVTPFDNYDLEAWVVIGPNVNDGDDILIGQIDEDTWVTTWAWTPFSYQFTAPSGPFRIGFRYHGNNGATAGLDAIRVDGTTGPPAHDCNLNGIPDECDIASGTSHDCNHNGIPDECDIATGHSSDSNNNGVPDECELPPLFVDDDAPAGGDGRSWATAFRYLQDALGVAMPGQEIHVAQGTYWPDRDAAHPNGTGNRTATFELKNGVAVRGGYAGLGAPDPEARNILDYPTILSGEIGAVESPNDNSEHVVTAGSLLNASTVLDGVRVTGGSAGGAGGGGVHCEGSPTLASCTLTRNTSGYNGGGMTNSGSPTLTNCTFIANTAGITGGGLENFGSPTLTNCTLTGNRSRHSGGGLYSYSGAPTLTNCTLSRNTAAYGGGLYTYSGVPMLRNCIVWDNGGGALEGSGCVVSYSDVQGGHDGAGNINVDPRFEGGAAVSLRLRPGSPCIDAGSNGAVPPGVATDLDGRPRFIDDPATPDTGVGPAPVVDMGAYEYTPDCNGNGVLDSQDIALGTSQDCNGNGIPDECDLARGISLDADGNGVPDECDHPVLYVDDDAPVGGNGYSWAAAYRHLADALAVVVSGQEVHVASGTYRPDRNAADPNGTGSRTATFQLQNGVVLRGGYAGLGQPDPNAWNLAAFPTILSGAIGAVGDPNDNSLHVVTAGSLLNASTVLDGVCVTGGNASGSTGGGVYCQGSPTLTNCTLSGNNGGGMNSTGSPTLANCTFGGNSATSGGGLNTSGSPTLTSCTFSGNTATSGGGLYTGLGSPTLTNCTFSGNTASYGGGLFNDSSPALTNCTFTGNSAYSGGGLYNGGSLTLTNCTFSGNVAAGSTGDYGGGAFYNNPAGTMPGLIIMSDVVIAGNASRAGNAGLAKWGQTQLDGVLALAGDGAPLPGAGDLNCDGIVSYADINPFVLAWHDPAAYAAMYPDCGGELDLNCDGVVDYGDICVFIALLSGGRTGIPSVIELRSGHQFSGPGRLELARNTVLKISSAPADSPVSVRTQVRGLGDIVIEAGQRMVLEGGAVVDLSGEAGGGCADPNGSAAWGTIWVDGSLVVRDSTIQNTNVTVRIGDLGGTTQIYNNLINLLQNPPGWGGEFYVEGGAQVRCNVIRSDGDRYLDLDPDPTVLPRPVIELNRIYVTIRQGSAGEQGELLELRTRDFDADYAGGLSGAYELPNSPGYADTWVLDQLQVGDPNHPAAKVNLTNRPGFVFQDPNIAIPEALYVKELRLDPGAVLNTGMQRMYYQSLVDENGQPLIRDPNNPSAPLTNGSRIVDIPLLGFSLKVIAMEDETEFAVRVRPRTRAPDDTQPADPNDPNTPPLEGWMGRVAAALFSDPNNTVMQVLTHAPGKQSASSVAAHGAFARAGEDQIVIEFKYRFCGASDPNTVLAVYLSDSPEVGNSASADPTHYVEVARVYPPQAGRPGSIRSGDFATFHGIFPRGSLNFTRGTYVELELRGQDACVEIDDWDPQIKCTYACHDLSGDYGVSNRDYLLLLAEYGQPVPTHKGCLDSKLSEDQYVDLGDVLAWDAVLSTYPPPLNLCDAEPYSGGTGSAISPPTSGLLIAGKPNAAGVQEDRLYPFNPSGQAAGAALLPASAAEGGHCRGNGRLIRAADGKLYQLHATQGLVRMDTAARVITPGSQNYGGSMVDVGATPTGSYVYPNGVPLLDVAFSKSNPNVAYVSPVLVEPPDGSEYTYKAAARVELSGGTSSVTKLYGMDPRLDGCTNTSPPGPSECTLQGLREVEVDGQGNVFVLSASAQSPSNDWLLVYDESTGAERLRLLLTSLNPALRSPTALLVSASDPNHLYLASAVDSDPNVPQTHVYRCTIQRSGGAVTGVVLGQDIVITNPVSEPNNPLGYLATVTSLSESTSDGRVYVVGFTTAKVAEDLSTNDPLYQQLFSDNSILKTLPTLAQISVGSSGPITATALTGHDLAFPISAVFLGSGPAICRGDTNCDGSINYADINPFVKALSSLSAWQNLDINADGLVNYADINPFVVKLGSPGPCP